MSVTGSLNLQKTNTYSSYSTTSTATIHDSSDVPPYTETMPYAIASLAIAILGIGVALATKNLVIVVGGSIIALIGVSVFDQIMAYDAAHPKGSKSKPNIHKFMLYGVGGGIVKTILLITAITIKLLVIL